MPKKPNVDHTDFEWKVVVREMRRDDYDRIVELMPPQFKTYMPFFAGGCEEERLVAARDGVLEGLRQGAREDGVGRALGERAVLVRHVVLPDLQRTVGAPHDQVGGGHELGGVGHMVQRPDFTDLHGQAGNYNARKRTMG